MNQQPKEIDVFNRHERFSKLKVVGIALLIAVIVITIFYFFVKTLFTYTVDFDLNGGYVYGKTVEPQKLKFLQKATEPEGVKKEGYYIEYWSNNKNLEKKYNFNTPVWNSMTLYVKWADGVAVRLHFAEGEENEDLPLADLKGYYEWYLKPGSDWSLPLIYNNVAHSVHYQEQLLWYDNPECTGEPFAERSWTNLTENVDIYGRWFDTNESKFKVDSEGTLTRYLGHCNKIILPSGIRKIKDIDINKFTTGESDSLNDQAGTYHSVWQNVMDDEKGVNGLKLIYLNSEMVEIGDCAFKDCKALEQVKFLGTNVETIGEWAFANCSKLAEFHFPAKVKIIENNTFDGAFDSGKKVSLVLNNVETIEDKAFINSRVYSIELKKVKFIGANAFTSCHVIRDFVLSTPSVVQSNVPSGSNPNPKGIFFDTHTSVVTAQHLTIYIPEKLYTDYLSYEYWSMYSSVIKTIEE